MNDSGKAIKKLTTNYKLKTENLFVIHDDLDLPLGKIKISFGRGSAGHKGVESIMKELKTKDFTRFRLGIQNKKVKAKSTKEFVLQNFSMQEEAIVKKVIQKTCQAIKLAIAEGTNKAAAEYNK